MRRVSIIEFPSNLGLIEPAPGREPGVKKLPAWLREHGFYDLIGPDSVRALQPPPYSMHLDKESGVRNADAIARYAKEQSVLLQPLVQAGTFPFIIGGDCSILLGSALALKKAGNYALFYLDGHHDFMLPELSGTAGAAGMDVAFATGHGHSKLTNIDGQKPYFKEENVWCVGNREYDEPYVQFIRESGIRYIDLAVLRQMDIAACVDAFLHQVHAQHLDGFFIHIDVDVLNDDLMPAVDSRTPGGLSYEELDTILQGLLSESKATGLELTILDPDLDPTGQYTEEFVKAFSASFRKA
jgi:arginase